MYVAHTTTQNMPFEKTKIKSQFDEFFKSKVHFLIRCDRRIYKMSKNKECLGLKSQGLVPDNSIFLSLYNNTAKNGKM